MNKFRKTLVVDDDPASRFLVMMVLQELNLATEIVTLSDGKQALEYVQQHCFNHNAAQQECPDWILLDLNMPVMGGLEFLEHLRQLEQNNFIHSSITIVTSSSNPKDTQRAASYGVKGYMLKPVTEQNMREYLNKAGIA